MKKDNIRISIITIPAGFQPNVKVVYEEIADFFRQTSKNLRDSLLLKIIEQKKWEVVLEKILPKDELVWGLDENTGTVIDLKTKVVKTLGIGELHLLSA